MAMTRTRRLTGRFMVVMAGVLACFAWLGVTLLAGRPALRGLVDLSPQARFTFSDETGRLLDELVERGIDVRVDTFYEPISLGSVTNPDQAYVLGLFQRVQSLTTDLLRIYAARGRGAVEVTHYDRLRDVEKTRERLEQVNIGQQRNVLVVAIGKRHKVLSLNDDLAVIEDPSARSTPMPGAQKKYPTIETYKGEEAISSAIRSLLVEGTPRAYFLSGHGEISIREGVADSYSEFVGALLDEGYEVAELDLQRVGRVPDEATIVGMLEPTYELSPKEAEALFAYLRRGGRLFVNVSYRPLPADHNPRLASLGRLLGFELGVDLIAHLVRDERLPSSPGRGGFEAQNLYGALDPRHPITRPLVRDNRRPPLFKVAREIRVAPEVPDGVDVDLGLVTTGPYAWIAPRRGPDDMPDMSSPDRAEAFAPRSIGAVIEVDAESGDRKGLAVLFGGAGFRNQAGGFDINGDLALNTFNWLAERRELVTVRGDRYRPRRLEISPEQADRVWRLLVGWVPLSLLAISIVVFAMRRRS